MARILSAVQVKGKPYWYTFGTVDLVRARLPSATPFDRVQFEGDARFDGAQFTGGARFDGAQFTGSACFEDATFSDNAQFNDVQFNGDASFRGTQFNGNTWFDRTRFSGGAVFRDTQFTGSAAFDGVQFEGSADFDRAQFRYAGFEDARVGGDAEFEGVRVNGTAAFSGILVKGNARFGRAQFNGETRFTGAQFSEHAGFGDAQFNGAADFSGAQFSGTARFPYEWCAHFGGARFGGDAEFRAARFSGDTRFRGTQFERSASFHGTTFRGDAEFPWSHDFGGAQFKGDTGFGGARFSGIANFADARFETATSFGPLVASDLLLQRAVFVRPVVLEAVAASLTCTDVTWEAGVTMQLRHARVDLERATFTVPSFVVGADRPFELPGEGTPQLNETMIVSSRPENGDALDDRWMPVVSSLRGVDAFNLSVTDVDLSQCRFAGARHLDQLRLEGRCVFDRPPEGLFAGRAWPPVWRWSRRQSLAEERSWRAATPRYTGWAETRSTAPAERPERLAGLYRQLRKAQEDARNEPGAADFYYGEMEMRRHARTSSGAERATVRLYWLVSGYGLRALRSLAALLIVGVIVTTALTGWGFAGSAPAQHLTGTIITTTPRNRAQIDAALHPARPGLPPASQRWTRQRAETALQITLESIAFRSTDQPLTPAGAWTTIAARILGPVLLALTLLAVRNRIKR
jgi:uncharacterized protein YjbI with pentapeptide repeats